ncbi:hypothetical protein A3J61_00640 [Candidatus Nomurabacteria bacterium RIFCSPHIGHO2_02_FULL_38_15]|uniref:RecF/RecN/SMC N-terminal domain-containing protein n=1 Tax=Candidatus Nomurabacteria bacterium RIFCSPHIGHO2_02_FULL_38_15 TaxID=1801752 RepID=A0A1F6VSU7_9BACT|nr:MAG: hypothetical protein A3J61_00640 [Candidatus Nomurabacteria bacterium RIFCSPHIGHO2_02_FULL_38_15]
MQLKSLELTGFKSFAKKHSLDFMSAVTAVVGPNGSGKSNVVEAIRFVLGEQSNKSMRSKAGADLIFKGSKNLEQLNRAKVEIFFDNTDRQLNFQNSSEHKIELDFDEVRIAREVFRDGANKYLINGSEVRLKDITELLASIHIGASGHHIISQGEADRILSATPRDRKSMIEDALGLRIYQLRMKEAERKLEKSRVNLKEVASLRRELAPHLTFLKRQVEKVEKAKTVRTELEQITIKYYANEKALIMLEQQTLDQDLILNKNLLASIKFEIENVNSGVQNTLDLTELNDLKKILDDKEKLRRNIEQSIARIEGMVSMLVNKNTNTHENSSVFISVSIATLKEEFRVIESVLDIIKSSRPNEISEHVIRIKNILKNLINNQADANSNQDQDQNQLLELENEKSKLVFELAALGHEILKTKQKIDKIEQINTDFNKNIQSHEFALRAVLEREGDIKTKIALLERDQQAVTERDGAIVNFEEEMAMLLGPQIIHTARATEVAETPPKDLHTEDRRTLERLKIKLEELGGIGGGEVMREYNETFERDQFLEKEVTDIENSILNISNLIVNLREEMNTLFKKGIENINAVFKDFFSAMFGGGNAFLSIITEHKKSEDNDDFVVEQGIDINVSLPHKKVKDLHMLSGGERSLTSIALLFSMSQVTPPPFLVLDETDAALDEANSRRYGDMVERLSKLSQLIVVTHNRETMSRAGVLYGVTIGSDGSSKLLSVKFDEATQYAK